jgi:hypothetical protein
MTSYEVSIGFWAIGYTFHAFYGPFLCLSSRELLSTIQEDRMTHFVTITVPPPRNDHSLRHSTTRAGLRARRFQILWLHKKRPFRTIFVSYNPRKWPETDVFRENAPANPSGSETYPWWCYALNSGRYVEEGLSECRNASFFVSVPTIVSRKCLLLSIFFFWIITGLDCASPCLSMCRWTSSSHGQCSSSSGLTEVCILKVSVIIMLALWWYVYIYSKLSMLMASEESEKSKAENK